MLRPFLRLVFFLLLLSPSLALATTVVQANLKDLFTSSLTSKTFVRFRLRNFGGNVPRVTATGVVVEIEKDCTVSNGCINSSTGALSTTVYDNVADITPTGTYYTVEFWHEGKMQSAANFRITEATFNLNSAAPISTAPVVSAPTGDTTYLRTDSGNTNLTGTNAFVFGKVNNIVFANAVSGANAGAKIVAAIALLPSTGGTVDARGLEGAQTIAQDIFSGVSKPVRLVLGAGTWTLSVAQTIPGNDVSIEGGKGTIISVTHATADMFTISGEKFKIGNVRFTAGVTRTAGYLFSTTASDGLFESLELNDMYGGFYIGPGSHNTFRNINIIGSASTWNAAFYLQGDTIDHQFENIRAYLLTGTVGDAWIHCNDRASGLSFTRIYLGGSGGSGIGLKLTYTSGVLASRPELIRLNSFFIEGGASQPAIQIQGAQDVKFVNSYFASSLRGFDVSGESTGIHIENSLFVNIQREAIKTTATAALGAGYATLHVLNNDINASSQETDNTYDAISIGAGVSDFVIMGNRIGLNNFPSLANDARYGVSVATGASNRYQIALNNFRGVKTAGISDAGTGTDKGIVGNVPDPNVVNRLAYGLRLYGTGNQLSFGPDAAPAYFNVANPAAQRIYTFADPGFDDSIVTVSQVQSLFNKSAIGVNGGTTPTDGYFSLGASTVAGLPTAAAGNAGQMIKVTDSTAITTEGQTCVGGSSTIALAFSNGTVWKCF